jgi:hypothetical protein
MPSPDVSIVRLRDAVRERVEATSRRGTAREIGVTPRGLELFLSGSKPQPKTLAKLLGWYEQHVALNDGPPISDADAIRVLLRRIDPEARQEATERLVAFLSALYASPRGNCPSAVDPLSDEG